MGHPSSNRFIRSHLKVKQLTLLVELGRHGSIAHAAEAAGLTQPGASKLLAELEHALGVALFQRLPRGVEPTWYGEIMIRRAGAALAEMDAAHQEIMRGLAGVGGRVTIGSVLTPSVQMVPEAIKLLKARSAQVQAAVTVDTSKRLIELLRAGELDLAVCRILDPAVASELQFEPVADEPHSVIVRAGHPWLRRSDLTLAELATGQWIMQPPGLLRDRLNALFVAHGLELPADTIETMAMSTIPRLLTNSDMMVVLPEELVREQLDAGTLAVLPVDLGLKGDVYGIVTRRKHLLSPAAEVMLQALRDAAADLPRRAS